MSQTAHRDSASLLTRADYEHYRGVLDELRRVRDRDLPELLRDARGFVAFPGRVVDVEYTRSGKRATYRIEEIRIVAVTQPAESLEATAAA